MILTGRRSRVAVAGGGGGPLVAEVRCGLPRHEMPRLWAKRGMPPARHGVGDSEHAPPPHPTSPPPPATAFPWPHPRHRRPATAFP